MAECNRNNDCDEIIYTEPITPAPLPSDEGGGGEGGFNARIVDKLPTTGEAGYVYLVKKSSSAEGDVYDEWIWVLKPDNKYGWEHIGTTSEVNLEDYYTKGEMDGKLNRNLLAEENTGFYTNASTRVSLHLGRYNPVTGATGYVDKDIPNAGRNSVGMLTKDDYTKFDDAANQTETNTQDISEALGQIAALDADKLGIDNILEGAGVTITKEGEGRETKLTISTEGGGSGVKELTTEDYNWPTSNPTGIAIWLLEPGMYIRKAYTTTSLTCYYNGSSTSRYHILGDSNMLIVGGENSPQTSRPYMMMSNESYLTGGQGTGYVGTAKQSSGTYYTPINSSFVKNNLTTSSSTMEAVLDARQGKVLNDKIGGDLSNLTTEDKSSLINAINEIASKEGGGSGVEVTQEPGGSTTSVMSQDAATKLIYTNTTNRESIKIGNGSNGGADGNRTVTIGKDAATTSSRGTTLGTGAMTSGDYGIALGAGSTSSEQGEFSVGGSGLGTNGYDGTNTRLITNVHDPVNAQDAATKAYVDSHAGGGKAMTAEEFNQAWDAA